MNQQKDFLEQRIDNYVMRPVPGLVLPAIPAITQVVVPEFDRSNFDTPLARVDRCQSCHVVLTSAALRTSRIRTNASAV